LNARNVIPDSTTIQTYVNTSDSFITRNESSAIFAIKHSIATGIWDTTISENT